MEEVITVEEYRNKLIEYYKYKYDEDTYELRKRTINSVYSDEYLFRIISDTKIMAEFLINKLIEEKHFFDDLYYTSIPIEENTIRISNGCIGGWASDNIYLYFMGIKEYMISDYILSLYLPNFKIYIHEDTVENMEDEDIGSFTPIRKLFINCKKEIFDKISSSIDINEGPKKQLLNNE